ncbi:MAG: AMP-binding protein, partial [Pseudomonadales bacterium]|nr:AMP-binding protein [Pseudomonadales bacterium]
MNSYGPTECSDVVAFHWLGQHELENNNLVIPIGKAINNTQLTVLDRNQQQVPVGVVGELCIAGEGVGVGYLNREDLTD